jgi:hypothetical protein
MRSFLLTIAVFAFGAVEARAATVLFPSNGETISSMPSIVVSDVPSYINYEFSQAPDLMQVGPDAGSFVDAVEQEFLGFPKEGVVAYDSPPLKPGAYFFHAQDGDSRAWSPVIRVVVRDEVPVFAGWTVAARRAKSSRPCKQTRVALSGTVRYLDNASDGEELRLGLPVSAGGSRVGRITATGSGGRATFSGVVCTSSRRLTVGLSLKDEAGHIAAGPSRVVSVR